VVTLAINASGPVAAGTPVVLSGQVTDLTATTARVLLDGTDIGGFDPAGTTVDTTGFRSGSYTLRVDASDALGHVGTKSVAFEIDNPDSTIDTPTDGQALGSSSAHVTGTLNDASGPFSYTLDSEPPVALDLDVPAGIIEVPFDFTLDGLSDGPHTVTVTAGTGTVTRHFSIDTVDPVVGMSSPTPGQNFFPGDLLDFAGTVTDDGIVDWTLTDGETELGHGTHRSSDDDSISIDDIDTSEWAPGAHQLMLSGTDRSGHEAHVEIRVTIGVPQLSLTSPVADAIITGGSFALAGWITDDDLTAWTAWVAGGPRGASTDQTLATGDSAGVFARTIDASSLADGSYTLYLTVADGSGNSNEVSIPITIDNSIARSAIVAPTAGQRLNSAGVRVQGALGVLGSPSYSVDGGPMQSVPGSVAVPADATTRPFDFWLYDLSEGEHTVTVSSTPISISRTFLVDLDPRIADLSWADESWVAIGDTITVGATVTDSSQVAYGLTWSGQTFTYSPFGAAGHIAPTLSTAGLTDGEYQLELHVVDKQFNETVERWTVYLDVRPGKPTLVTPTAGGTTADREITFGWDPLAGADFYEFRSSPNHTTDTDGTLADGTTIVTADGESFATLTGVAEGDIYWQVRGVNRVGESTSFAGAWSDTRKVEVDRTRPSSPLTPPASPSSSDGTDEAAHDPDGAESGEPQPTEEPSDDQSAAPSDPPVDDPEAAGASDDGFPVGWIVVVVVIIVLVGGGFLIRFLIVRR
jgi:hypothetical protein